MNVALDVVFPPRESMPGDPFGGRLLDQLRRTFQDLVEERREIRLKLPLDAVALSRNHGVNLGNQRGSCQTRAGRGSGFAAF